MKLKQLITFLLLLGVSLFAFSQVIVLEKKGLETSEGIYLEADIYLPDTLQPHPTILLRTPYGKYQYQQFGHFMKKANLKTYQTLRAHNKPHQQLIFGPWFHNQYLLILPFICK